MQNPSSINTEPDNQSPASPLRGRLPDGPATEVSPPVHATVTEWLSHGMSAAPDALAIQFESSGLTYEELDGRANRIADALRRMGVKTGDRVGLCLNRSIELVAAVIGILKSGAAYVPLDPAYPAERLSMMQQDADLRLLLVQAAYAAQFADATCALWCWENFEDEVRQASSAPPEVQIDPENVAYVIFTSGSTGRPKGISMPHRALSNLIEWQLERKTFKPGARVLQYSSISFDVSFQEIATTLASGGTLYLINDDDRKDPRILLSQLLEHGIERLYLPYVAMRSMIEAAHVVGTFPAALKEVVTAGEQLRVDDAVRDFFDRIDGASLDNQYGPSETHVITAHLLEGDPARWPDLPPIGRPLKNCAVYILDEHMEPVPDGESGELYLAGRNLGHGYINSSDLTNSVFITNPFQRPGYPLLYKTGDLASCSEGGLLSFLGRRDHQIKIRGHRIEPGEINSAASSLMGIGQCLTHAIRGHDGGLRLVTYFTITPGAHIDSSLLRDHLRRRLPEYMIPSFFVELDRIPYTPSGKVNLKALPKPQINDSCYGDDDCVYQSETEEALALIWCGLLDLDKIPRSAEFFELGGDSLRAVTLFLRIQQHFGMELPLATLAHSPTLATLAKQIELDHTAVNLTGYRSLQLLKRGNVAEPPLFLIHGGKGNVLTFKAFADGLDPSQPVYAFQWSGWDGHRGERSIPKMAQSYAAEIERFLRGSACRLGGNCIGGLIAIEVARLLAAKGISLDRPLLIWDAPNLNSPSYQIKEPWNDPEQRAMLERVTEALLDRTPEHRREAIIVQPEQYSAGMKGILQRVPYLRRIVQWCKTQYKLLPVYGARLTGRKIPIDVREFYCLRSMLTAVSKHKCSSYEGDVLYFRSHSVLGRDMGIPGWWNGFYLGFEELCNGCFEAHVVGGLHCDITGWPEIARIVRQKFEN